MRRWPGWRLGAADPGSHRGSDGPGRSHRARLHRPDLPHLSAASDALGHAGRGVVLGRQRLGINLLSLICALREEGRMPLRTIQWYLKTVHQLPLSLGAIVRVIHQAAQKAQPTLAQALDCIPGQPGGPRRRDRLA